MHDDVPAADYAYLLGIYRGDGCLGPAGRSVALRIVMDAAYPGIIEEVVEAIHAVRGEGTVSRYRPRDERCVVLTSYTRAWTCLLRSTGRVPSTFGRGLIHSDGWRGVHRVRVKGRDYEYPRYQFSNRSPDIRRLFTDAMDELGVAWRPWGRFHVSVARRDAVALLDRHVGPKA
jgi:hypothetical protein